MELEFDKEMDALLRGQARFIGEQGPGAADNGGGPAAGHLDADELTAFAENAVSGPVRQAYTLHLADCDRCRKILSQSILLDESAEEPSAAAVAAPALIEATVPWYRRLFLFPNLAYVMGGLVLVLGGFMAFEVVQNIGRGSTTGEVSQVADREIPARGPNLGEDPTIYSSNAANTMTNTAAVTTNTDATSFNTNRVAAANTNTASTVREDVQPMPASTPAQEKGIVTDGLDLARGNTLSPPAAAPTSAAEADQPKAKQNEVVAKQAPQEKEETRARTLRQLNDLPRISAAGSSKDGKKVAGPSRNQQSNFPNTLSQSNEAPPSRRIVSGKTFELKHGAWYDNSYQGAATINIRRGTFEYRKLDRGLRSIADSLGGTAVIVWKGKSYRVQ